MKRIAIASHVALIDGKQYDGIGNVLIETLNPTTDEFFFVRHSLDGLLDSEVHLYQSSKISKIENLVVIKSPSPLRYIMEVIKTVRYFSTKAKIDVFVGVDPLNGLAGVLLKKRKKVDTAIFYTADYSDNRFENKLLSKIYHLIDAYCVKNADEVWSVSSRIVDIRKKMGLSSEKIIFLPNVPPVEFNKFRENKHDKYSLITYGIVDKQLDFDGAIKAVAALVKDFPKISFTVVGNGPEENRLKQLASKSGVANRVHFLGQKPLSETLKIASKSGIGLALYTGVWGFNKYGDSTKCREFFNYGLPVLSTDTHSTVGDITDSGAGIIVKMSVDEYVDAIKQIIDEYEDYSKKSLQLGKKYEGAHRKELLRILN